MKYIILILLCAQLVQASEWPKEIKTEKGGVITIYQPQPEKMEGNKVTGRAAFSGRAMPGDELVFGVFWFKAALITDRDSRMATMEKILITDVRLPGMEDQAALTKLKSFLEQEIPKWEITASLDEITATIEEEQQAAQHEFKNDPPNILFRNSPTLLVLIDGEPKVQQDPKLKMNKVVNSPFLIVQDAGDKKYYLSGGSSWYASSSIVDGYQPVKTLPKSIAAVDAQMKKDSVDSTTPPDSIPPSILISTKPAELLQTKGEPQFANINSTSLLYVSNSSEDIFKYVSDQNYYVLISGRWYISRELAGPWSYLPPDKLPADFAQIPEGSPKDNVLSSVPGTQACKNAVMDAQIPQTAKVDRKATIKVTYDGAPKFEPIQGTSLQLAMNTKSTVIKDASRYYCVENGVWFIADQPVGPWKVSDTRPASMDKIPPSSSAYNAQYVYIYDSTPDVVYVGYTPGYMGCYVYGGTVVYGTGFYYNPWYGPYYYPRPVTYGFSMHYNPWCGWSMGFHYSTGRFSFSVYGGGGYWGPPMYRPPYYPPYRGGMYGGRGPNHIEHYNNINRNRTNNLYNNRAGVSTNDVRRGQNAQPRVSQPTAATRNNVYSDRNGNVYQRSDNGNWSQRSGNEWRQSEQSNMNRDYERRQRSEFQNNSFQQMNRGGNMGGGARMGGGRRR